MKLRSASADTDEHCATIRHVVTCFCWPCRRPVTARETGGGHGRRRPASDRASAESRLDAGALRGAPARRCPHASAHRGRAAHHLRDAHSACQGASRPDWRTVRAADHPRSAPQRAPRDPTAGIRCHGKSATHPQSTQGQERLTRGRRRASSSTLADRLRAGVISFVVTCQRGGFCLVASVARLVGVAPLRHAPSDDGLWTLAIPAATQARARDPLGRRHSDVAPFCRRAVRRCTAPSRGSPLGSRSVGQAPL